jgi:hypothetical protein
VQRGHHASDFHAPEATNDHPGREIRERARDLPKGSVRIILFGQQVLWLLWML